MIKMYTAIIFLTLLFLVACTPQPELAPTPTPESEVDVTRTIVLGDIDQDDPLAKIEEFQPIADYLVEQLSDFGIGSGAVSIAPDLDTMINMMAAGEIDIYYDSLYPAMIIADATGARPLLRGWRGGEPIYRSIFFVLADSGISSLENLNGKLVAYDDRVSTSGYMMPTSHLISNGLNPVEKSSPESSVPNDEVGYIFSNDDENTIEWVLSGRVQAGVVDNLTYLSDIPEETRENLTIIAETIDVPRRVLMIGPNVEPELATLIAEIFMGLDETEEGQALLEIVKTAQFDEFPDGIDASFEPIQEMFNVINDR